MHRLRLDSSASSGPRLVKKNIPAVAAVRHGQTNAPSQISRAACDIPVYMGYPVIGSIVTYAIKNEAIPGGSYNS